MRSVMDSLPLSLRRGIKRGAQNVRREDGFGTALGSLFGVLFLGQILVLLVFGVEGGLRLLQEQTDLRLEISESATDRQIQDLFQNVRQLPYVADAVYITREQAYEREKKRDPELITFLDKFGIENPFPETMGVRLQKLSDYPAFVAFLQQPVFATVVNPTFLSKTTDQEQQVYRLIEAVRAGEYILFFVVLLLVIAILFVVVELVRRKALSKREELLVEQLVGASRTTTLIPFCTEMICLLASALILSILFAAAVVSALPFLLPELGSAGLFGTWSESVLDLLIHSLVWLIPVEILSIAVLAVLGTACAITPQFLRHLLRFLKPN